MPEDIVLPNGLDQKKLNLIWIYLPILLIIAQSVIIYKLAEQNNIINDKLMELQEKRIKEKAENEQIWRDAFFNTDRLIRNGNESRNDIDNLHAR